MLRLPARYRLTNDVHQSSASVYTSFLLPLLRRYETPIDLTLLLFQSLAILIGHYLIQLPVDFAWRALPLFSSAIIRLFTACLASPGITIPVRRLQEADVDPDADIQIISPRTSPRSSLEHHTSHPHGPRMRRKSPAVLRRYSPRVPSAPITVLDSDEDVAGPLTPRPARQTENTGLKLPLGPPTLRRSPRRHHRSTDRGNLIITAPDGVTKLGLLTPISSQDLVEPEPPSKSVPFHKPASRPSSRSAPTVRSANLPIHRAESTLLNDKIVPTVSATQSQTSQRRIVKSAPIRKDSSSARPRIMSTASLTSRASSTAFTDSSTPATTMTESAKARVNRSSTQNYLVEPKGSSMTQALYPRLPSGLAVTVTAKSSVHNEKQRSTAASRSKTIRTLDRTVGMEMTEKVGEKRRAVVGAEGEGRPMKRRRAEVRAEV